MANRTYRDPWVKKAKWLTQALIISGTLNVGLLSTFIYFAVSEKDHSHRFEQAAARAPLPQEEMGMRELIQSYMDLTFQELLAHLKNSDHVESGYACRDIALAILAEHHYFNLERALGGLSIQKRTLKLGPEQTLTIYPGLADYQYQAVLQYAHTEKWPLTSEGLFKELQKQRPPYDPSLVEALSLTPEFHFTNLLFTKTGIHLKRENAVALLAQTPYSTLAETTQHLRTHLDFSVEERRRFLLQLTSQSSKLAAKILLETDTDYCLKHLNNDQVLFLCDLLQDNTNPAFLKQLLESPRSDDIWKKAASILYVQAAEPIPEQLDQQIAKRRFLELKTMPASAPKKVETLYTVQSGDSLWKIAREHKTSVQALREVNGLRSDKLKIGQKLKLPRH